VRVALCGGTTSPGIYEVIEVLGKDETIKRIRRAMAFIANPREDGNPVLSRE